METVSIRKATLEDLPTLLRFEQEVIEAERPFDPTLKQTETNYYDLPGLIANSNARLVVAELNNRLVGCGYARIEQAKPYLQHSRFAYLGFMYTIPAHRGKGINRQVIEALKAWAISKGTTEFRLEVYADNLPAIKAYEKVGFQPIMLQMRMDSNPGKL